jgi:hypothetical protein
MLKSAQLKRAKSEWDKFFASFWRGVTRKNKPPLSRAGKAAYHQRWEAEMSRIAAEQKNPDASRYYQSLARKHGERAKQLTKKK